ncbi:MAG: zinc ABC transporter substrate-binding protein [Thermodesulfobacteriota bacterium]
MNQMKFQALEKIYIIVLIAIASIFSFVDIKAETKVQVYTVNYPLKYFAERIGGELVEVYFPAPSGVDPVYWFPGADVVREYQKADLILLNGAGYAKWIKKATLPRSKLVNTSKSFKDQYLYIQNSVTHSHGTGENHSHGEIAFTTWIDPELAIKQSEEIKNSLIKILPDNNEVFEANFSSLKNDLIKVDNSLKDIFAKYSDIPLIASHPVYQYLQRRYQINLKSVHWEPDEYPNPEQWLELDKILKEHPASLMIWENEPLPEIKEKLLEMKIKSVVFNPCGNTSEEGDYLSVMKRNIYNLKLIKN